MGIIDSLARPGGNVTGLTEMAAEIGGKRLQSAAKTRFWCSTEQFCRAAAMTMRRFEFLWSMAHHADS
jgi:hypothetical protein